MVEFKLTINEGPISYVHVVKEPEAMTFLGLKIGDIIKGDVIGLPGYEFIINGGSDNAGFPMRKNVQGADRAKVIKRSKNGAPIRRTVRGNIISESVTQINLKIGKKGSKPLIEYFPKKEEKKE